MESVHSINAVNLVGSGNVAWVLGSALKESGVLINAVIARKKDKAEELARLLDSKALSFEDKLPKADLILLTVSDDSIQEVSEQLAKKVSNESLIAHTSGSKPTTLLAPFGRQASFYPLQTMTKGNVVDFSKVHFCVYTKEESHLNALKELAGRISQHVHILDNQQRAFLHLSAVMVNNFSNLFFSEAYRLSAMHKIDFELLRPLIMKTAQKAMENIPGSVQTGPAARNDIDTIQQHLNLLESDPKLKELYQLISERIIKNADTD